MIRVMVTAAFAVGMMNVAVHAQEAPAQAHRLNGTVSAASASDAAATKGSERIETSSGHSAVAMPSKAAERSAREKKGRARIQLEAKPDVDQQKTSSVPKAKRPELVAKARKGEVLKGVLTGSDASSGKYGDIIARHAAANGVPVALARAVVRVESNFRADARGRAGEVGLMQIKPATARGLGYSGSTKALYDPETNIRWGMKYLGMAHKLGGGATCQTILRYNAGHGAKRMNPISAAYCSKVKRHLAS